jgi:hypothetical protein
MIRAFSRAFSSLVEREKKKFVVIASPGLDNFAERLQSTGVFICMNYKSFCVCVYLNCRISILSSYECTDVWMFMCN